MSRRRKADEVMSAVIPTIKVTPSDLQKLKDAAEAKDMSLSDYVRMLIFTRLPKHRIKKLQLVDTNITAELCRLGGNLRDLYNEHGHENGFDSDASAKILGKISATLDVIRETYDRYLEREFTR